MSEYRRLYQPGGCYFFTVVTLERRPLLTQPQSIARLRAAFKQVTNRRPFEIESIVIMPDHLHCLWRLPEGDNDFSTRWRLIKRYFAVGIDTAVNNRREKAVWQRRYWERLIRDEEDWLRHMDYIHYNPVKHGYVTAPADWPHSSFQQAVLKGLYPADWGVQSEPAAIAGCDFE